MEAIQVTTITDIKQGDTLIIKGDRYEAEPFKAQVVKVTEQDGTEIILNKRKNIFFNLGMYLEGESWVKNVIIIR